MEYRNAEEDEDNEEYRYPERMEGSAGQEYNIVIIAYLTTYVFLSCAACAIKYIWERRDNYLFTPFSYLKKMKVTWY